MPFNADILIRDPTQGGAVGPSGLTSLLGTNPAQIAAKKAAEEAAKAGAAKFGLGTLMQGLGPLFAAYSVLDALGFFDGSGLKETPMTPEERAKFEAESRLALASSGLAEGGEGAYETLIDAIAQASDTEGVSEQEINNILGQYGYTANLAAGPGGVARLKELDLEQRQVEAAQKYAELVLGKQPTTAKEFADIEEAKQALIDLNVSREQIEAATVTDAFGVEKHVDTSQGISGVMGPTIGGVASQAGQKILDIIGGGGQVFSDISTLGTGPEVAQTLIDPLSILLGGFGGTINYSDAGPITPLILGTTTSGQPVGLNIPDPRTIFESGLGSLIPAAGAIIGTAGALSFEDEDRGRSGVGITPAGALTATMEGGVPDQVAGTSIDTLEIEGGAPDQIAGTGGRDIVAGDAGATDTNLRTGGRDIAAGDGDVDIALETGGRDIAAGDGDVDTDTDLQTGGRDIAAGDGDVDIALETGGGEKALQFGGGDDEDITLETGGGERVLRTGGEDITLETGGGERVLRTGGEDITLETGGGGERVLQTAGGGGGGGGGGTSTPPPSLRGVREEPGDLVDIKYLYDFAKGLDQPFVMTEEDRIKNLYTYAEGGVVANEDAVDMLTRPRRPGEYGRSYFTPGQFVPTGTALGGAALDPNQIQIPQYTYQRELLPQFGGPAAGVTTPTTMPAGTNVYTPPTLSDTLGLEGIDNLLSNITGIFGGGAGTAGTTQEDYTEGLATDASTQAAVNEALAGTGGTAGLGALTDEQMFQANNAADFVNSLNIPAGTSLDQITPAQLQQLRGSGFNINNIASALGVGVEGLREAMLQNTVASTGNRVGTASVDSPEFIVVDPSVERKIRDYTGDPADFQGSANETLARKYFNNNTGRWEYRPLDYIGFVEGAQEGIDLARSGGELDWRNMSFQDPIVRGYLSATAGWNPVEVRGEGNAQLLQDIFNNAVANREEGGGTINANALRSFGIDYNSYAQLLNKSPFIGQVYNQIKGLIPEQFLSSPGQMQNFIRQIDRKVNAGLDPYRATAAVLEDYTNSPNFYFEGGADDPAYEQLRALQGAYMERGAQEAGITQREYMENMGNTTSVRTTRQQQIYGGPGRYGLVLENDEQTPDLLHSVAIVDPYGNRMRSYLLRGQKDEAIKYITELGADPEGVRNALAGWVNDADSPDESDVNITGTATTDTTVTGGTDYNNFIGNYFNRTLTAEDATALANSGYSLNQLATSLEVDPAALREFVNYHTNGFITTDDGRLGTVGMRNMLVNQLGYTENADGTISDPTTGTTYSIQDGAWRPIESTTLTGDTAGTTLTGDTAGTTTNGTRELTTAELKQAVLDGTMSYSDALDRLNVADDPNPFGFTEEEQMALGIHESQRTGRGYKYNEATGSMDLYDYDTDTFVDTAFEDYVSNYKNTTLTKDDLLSIANSGYDLGRIAEELEVDVDELNDFIGRAQTQDVLDSVDPTDGFSTEEQDAVAQLLAEDKTEIGSIAEQYDLDVMDVIEGVLRGGYETPAEMVERLAPYNEGLTEEELIIELLKEGYTTPAEVASYYGVDESLVRERAGLAGGGYLGGKGYYLGGPTDGMADKIPATINNMQPAALSDGEFVIPADVVSHLGNGNSEAGAQQLYSMMDRVRAERTGTTEQGPRIDPTKMMPA